MSNDATLASGQAAAGTTGGASTPPMVLRQHLLTDLLDDAVRRYGDRPAIDFLGRVTHYAELGEAVERAARGLQDLGVKPGTRVGLCLPNTPYYPILYFATLRVGGVVVNMNPLYVVRELLGLIEDSGAEVIVTCDLAQFHDRAVATLAQTQVRHVIICPIADALSPLKRFAYKIFKRRDIAPELNDPRALHFADLIANPAAR